MSARGVYRQIRMLRRGKTCPFSLFQIFVGTRMASGGGGMGGMPSSSQGHPGPHHPGLPQVPPQTQQPTTAQVDPEHEHPDYSRCTFQGCNLHNFPSLHKTETATWRNSIFHIVKGKRTSMRRLPRLDKVPLGRFSRQGVELIQRRLLL